MSGPPHWPQPPGGPPGWQPARPQQPGRPKPPDRPVDVDTGFWLWLAALPVMTTGYAVNLLASPEGVQVRPFYPIIGLVAVSMCAVVVAFLVLMRSGYRWARTVLTGGAVAAVVYAVTGLFDADARPVIAVITAVSGIVGSVLIGGGIVALHRDDAQGYFTR